MVRITSAGCIYEFPTLLFIDLYFCFYYKIFDATFVFDNRADINIFKNFFHLLGCEEQIEFILENLVDLISDFQN